MKGYIPACFLLPLCRAADVAVSVMHLRRSQLLTHPVQMCSPRRCERKKGKADPEGTGARETRLESRLGSFGEPGKGEGQTLRQKRQKWHAELFPLTSIAKKNFGRAARWADPG